MSVQKAFRWFMRFFSVLVLSVWLVAEPISGLARPPFLDVTSEVANYTVREGLDFATRALRDPWDMSEYTDISQWINHAGHQYDLSEIQVQNGIFSARTSGDYSEAFVLFPGYEPGLLGGKVGARYPIETSVYGCFYMAMYAETEPSNYYYYNVLWAADRSITWGANSVWGVTYGNTINHGIWKLYSINLRTWPTISGHKWNERDWQALRVAPLLYRPDARFFIDWVRLTDCQPVNVQLTGLPSGSYSLWVDPGNPAHEIRVVDTFSPSGGSYTWDVQGLAAGQYNYRVKSGSGSVIQQGTLRVVPSPIAQFTRPSMVSGQDYSSLSGNAWDFSDSGDFTDVRCATESLANGILSLDTLPPSQRPNCVRTGAGEMDPIVYMNTPTYPDIRQYRYLSFHHLINGSWSIPEMGMVVRLVWVAERPGPDCYFVSREIALDVIWQTYSIDMFDSWNGMPIESSPTSCGLVHWKNETGVVRLFRLDPNENITSSTLHQEFDWLRITKVDAVTQGSIYPVKILLNKPTGEISSLSFYYTDNLQNPLQHVAVQFIPNPPPSNPFRLFLPINVTTAQDPFVTNLEADVLFSWNTAGVNLGEYYVCVQANDGYNQAIYCSEAPVRVVSP